MENTKIIEKSNNKQPFWSEVKVSQWGTTIIRYCKTCGEVHTVKDPHTE